jgi:hypothetical protein
METEKVDILFVFRIWEFEKTLYDFIDGKSYDVGCITVYVRGNCSDFIHITMQSYIFEKFVCWHIGKFQNCNDIVGSANYMC